MKTFIAALSLAVVALTPVAASAQAAATSSELVAGKMLYAADGKRVAPIYKVTDGGDVQVILNGKMVTVPGASISVADGKLSTNLGKPQLLASR